MQQVSRWNPTSTWNDEHHPGNELITQQSDWTNPYNILKLEADEEFGSFL